VNVLHKNCGLTAGRRKHSVMVMEMDGDRRDDFVAFGIQFVFL